MVSLAACRGRARAPYQDAGPTVIANPRANPPGVLLRGATRPIPVSVWEMTRRVKNEPSGERTTERMADGVAV